MCNSLKDLLRVTTMMIDIVAKIGHPVAQTGLLHMQNTHAMIKEMLRSCRDCTDIQGVDHTFMQRLLMEASPYLSRSDQAVINEIIASGCLRFTHVEQIDCTVVVHTAFFQHVAELQACMTGVLPMLFASRRRRIHEVRQWELTSWGPDKEHQLFLNALTSTGQASTLLADIEGLASKLASEMPQSDKRWPQPSDMRRHMYAQSEILWSMARMRLSRLTCLESGASRFEDDYLRTRLMLAIPTLHFHEVALVKHCVQVITGNAAKLSNSPTLQTDPLAALVVKKMTSMATELQGTLDSIGMDNDMLHQCTHYTLDQLYVDLLVAYQNGFKRGTLQGTQKKLPQYRHHKVTGNTLMMGLFADNGGCTFGSVFEVCDVTIPVRCLHCFARLPGWTTHCKRN